MTDYQPQPGERAVFHGPAVNSIEVLVADYRGHFKQVGDYRPDIPFLSWAPYADTKAREIRALDAETQAWSWDTLMEAKRRHESGEPLATLATHRLVKNTGNSGMHLEPIATEEDR